MNFFISFAGPVTFENAQGRWRLTFPLTGCLSRPAAVPYRYPWEGRNYPGNVKFVAEEGCQIKDMDSDALMECVLDNTRKLFGIDSRHYLSS